MCKITTKRTTSEFIELAQKLNGDKFEYSKVDYKSKDIPVVIICKDHGEFRQSPNNHLRGQGCAACAGVKKYTISEFISRARFVHGLKYDYTNSVYVTAHHKIEINCPTHGIFKQTPNNHLHGQKCPCCRGLVTNTLSFKRQADITHKFLYNYIETEYKSTHDKVCIICNEHGRFFQTPGAHLRGQGCPCCKKSGYRKNLHGTFYILQNEDCIKIGVTNRQAHLRAEEISRSCGKLTEIKYFVTFSDGSIPWQLEKNLLLKFKTLYSQPCDVFDGSTESFLTADIDWVIKNTGLEICRILSCTN